MLKKDNLLDILEEQKVHNLQVIQWDHTYTMKYWIQEGLHLIQKRSTQIWRNFSIFTQYLSLFTNNDNTRILLQRT